ncbi:ketohexokinase [Quercus suber]|uniref:Ketohexokinase n=1 Tax=Quercus suber TaxID=58331 RepID=A0AAW0JZR7_QUESU
MLGFFSLSTFPNNAIKLVNSQSLVSISATATKPITISFTRNLRVKMSSDTLPPPPEKGIVLGCGGASVDFLAAVATYPKPDDKIRTTSLKVQGGGNAGNALTCAARLGLKPRLISKIADDTQGRDILDEFVADGVDTSFLVVSEQGNSPFTYVIVDNQTKTRTCIHTAGNPPMIPDDLSQENLLSALDGARIAYFDGRLPETALVIAQEAWTEASSLPSALVSILLRLPNINFVIVTLGEDGCIMLERSGNESSGTEDIDVDVLLESLKQQQKDESTSPTCISSSVTRLRAKGIGTLCGRLFLGTAEKIPPSELIDTTGAGDAFIGAVIYAICADMPPEQMLPFAAHVAAANCRALGARTGLPYRTDPRLAYFLQQSSQVITSLAK